MPWNNYQRFRAVLGISRFSKKISVQKFRNFEIQFFITRNYYPEIFRRFQESVEDIEIFEHFEILK
jgi:hypothetical protein